jgi:hypothetical protein
VCARACRALQAELGQEGSPLADIERDMANALAATADAHMLLSLLRRQGHCCMCVAAMGKGGRAQEPGGLRTEWERVWVASMQQGYCVHIRFVRVLGWW